MKKISTCLIALSLAASALAAGNYTNGIYLVNEDWFGHNSSTVNFYSYDADTIAYRVYQAANAANGYTLGNTTQYAALAGGNMYFCSKQNYGTTGGRLDVADAKTLVRKASISTIGSADTRAFLSITASKAYVGTNKGIHRLNRSNLTLESNAILPEKEVRCRHSNGFNIFAGTADGGIYSFSYGKEPEEIRHPHDSPVSSIFVDSHGIVWFGDDRTGAARIIPSTHNEKLFQQLSSSRVHKREGQLQ